MMKRTSILIHNKCIEINGKFKIFAVKNPYVMKIFEITRLSNLFKIKK